MAIISNLLRIIAKPIILKLGKGLKSSKNKYCLGDEIDIQLDDSVVGKDNVIAKPPTRINSFSRWKDGVGKELTDSKTIQDDDGNTLTEVALDGQILRQTIINTSQTANSHAKQEIRTNGENSGNPYTHWSVNGQIDFSAGIDNSDHDAWKICRNFVLDNSPCLRIDKSGNVTKPLQIRCLALVPSTINNVLGNGNEYFFGTKRAMKEIKDIGNQFYPGDGTFGRADYTSNKNGSYYIEIVINFFNSQASANSATEFLCKVRVNGTSRTYENRSTTPSQLSRDGITTSFIIDTDIGDKLTFSIQGDQIGATQTISIFGSDLPLITTAIGVYCLG